MSPRAHACGTCQARFAAESTQSARSSGRASTTRPQRCRHAKRVGCQVGAGEAIRRREFPAGRARRRTDESACSDGQAENCRRAQSSLAGRIARLKERPTCTSSPAPETVATINMEATRPNAYPPPDLEPSRLRTRRGSRSCVLSAVGTTITRAGGRGAQGGRAYGAAGEVDRASGTSAAGWLPVSRASQRYDRVRGVATKVRDGGQEIWRAPSTGTADRLAVLAAAGWSRRQIGQPDRCVEGNTSADTALSESTLQQHGRRDGGLARGCRLRRRDSSSRRGLAAGARLSGRRRACLYMNADPSVVNSIPSLLRTFVILCKEPILCRGDDEMVGLVYRVSSR